LHLTETFIKKINQVMFKFIWRSRWEKIERAILCNNIREGRAKIIDIKQYLLALKFKWIHKFFDDDYSMKIKNLLFCTCG